MGTFRHLGVAERGIRILDRLMTVRFTTIAHVHGPLEREAMRRGLDVLVCRHPSLGAAIGDHSGRPSLVFGAGAPISLDWCEMGPEQVQGAVLATLQYGPWPDEGPRVQCRVFDHQDGSYSIALTYDHITNDGKSGVLTMRDLLRAVADPGWNPEPIDAPPQEQIVLDGLQPSKFQVLKVLFADLFADPLDVIAIDSNLAPEKRRFEVQAIKFSREETGEILRAARSAGCTVHGLLTAVALSSVRSTKFLPDRAGRMQVYHAVDLRAYLEQLARKRDDRSVDLALEAVGYYVSWIDTVHELRESPAKPDGLGREVTEAIQDGKARALPFVNSAFLGSALEFGESLLGERRLRRFVEKNLSPYAMAVSNLGVLERLGARSEVGELTVDDIHFIAAPSIVPLSSAISTFNGRLHWNLIFAEPFVEAQNAATLASEIRRRLTSPLDHG